MPFDENAAYRRIKALCSPAPARYLHIPTGIHWVVETEAWRKLP